MKMARLRELFEQMGFQEVWTFIASGNVVFEHDDPGEAALVHTIEQGLAGALGYEVPTFVRSTEDISDVVSFTPPGHDESRSMYVTFFAEEPDDDMRRRIGAIETDNDRFTFHGRELYWSIGGKLSDSPLFGTGIERAIVAPSTTRNATSLRKLAAKLETA